MRGPPAGAGWVPAAGRGGCRWGSPYLPARPRLRQEPGVAFPRAHRAQPRRHVRGVRGRPGVCAGSRAAGSCPVSESCLGLESLEKQREASLNPAKAKRRVAKREGCSGDACFLVGRRKEIFWRQQLWSERRSGHPAGAGRGCRGQEQGAAGTSTTSRDRDQVRGVRGGTGESTRAREHGDIAAQSRGLWGCNMGRGAHHPRKAPGRGAAPCPHPCPVLPSSAEWCVPLPQCAQPQKRCPISCTTRHGPGSPRTAPNPCVPAAPGRTAKNQGLPKAAG